MKVLVTGGYGFIGAHVVAALLKAGHTPVVAVRIQRVDTALPGVEARPCDFSRDVDPEHWLPRVHDMDAVVNCVGILREQGDASFETVHVTVPAALVEACRRAGVKRFVQVSALGEPGAGGFVASKHRGDARLLQSDVDTVVLRPSIIYSTRGSYGGSTLLRGLAALPLIPLPGRGDQRVQPLDAEDLAHAVLAALTRDEAVGQCLQLGGPTSMTLREYLRQWHRWLGLGAARFVAVPARLARCGAWLGEYFSRGPLGLTMWRMLERGNQVSADEQTRTASALDWQPMPLEQALSRGAASSADRWQARTVFLQPLLRYVLVATFLASGVVGFILPDAQVSALFAQSGWSATWSAPALGHIGSVLDIALGSWLLTGWKPRVALAAMALLVLGYSVSIGVLLPTTWLDPFGGLIKNALVLLGIAFAAAGVERR